MPSQKARNEAPFFGGGKSKAPSFGRGFGRRLLCVHCFCTRSGAAGTAKLGSDFFDRQSPASTTKHVLQLADARIAATDAVAEKGIGDLRAGSLGAADVY